MVYSSLRDLLDKYPHFLDKRSSSNFTKTRVVWNNRMIEFYNDLFRVYLAGKISKHILIWREQYVENIYYINFAISLPNLKTVRCYKNDEVIYSEEYEFDDEVDTFYYMYEGNTLTDTYGESINFNPEYDVDGEPEGIDPVDYPHPKIPEDKFKVEVETYSEYHLIKGYPENDVPVGDIYDHDKSLDDIGEFFNVPRKNYVVYADKKIRVNKDDGTTEEITIKEEVDYRYTEPPYNNCETEDDYHYMNRLLYYAEHFDDTPLPLLELWKLFGEDINASMVNREDILCKMFETKKHYKNGFYDEGWKPYRWEHKDMMCEGELEEIFFFANLNNSQPLYGRDVKFTFDFFDSLILDNYDYNYIIPIVNDVKLDLVLDYHKNPKSVKEWVLGTKELYDVYGFESDVYEFKFVFHAFKSVEDINDDIYIESDELLLIIKGCGNADWYVNPLTGNDGYEGSSSKPFKTLAKAVSKVEPSHNVIVLQEGVHEIKDTLKIVKNTSILCCSESTILNDVNCEMFSIKNDTFLDIQNVTLKHNCCEMFAEDVEFINNNKRSYNLNVVIPLTACKIPISVNIDNNNPKIYAHTSYVIKGDVLTKELKGKVTYMNCENNEDVRLNEPDLPVSGEDIGLYENYNLKLSDVTDDDGGYDFELDFPKSGKYTYRIVHDESENYCGNENRVLVNVVDMPTVLTGGLSKEKIYVYDELPVFFNVKDFYDKPVVCGNVYLYEDNKLVETIDFDDEFSYVPPVGKHEYKIVFKGDSYVTSELTGLEIEVVKYKSNMMLYSDKSYYMVDEDVIYNGQLYGEFGDRLTGKSVNLYVDNVKVATGNVVDGDVTFTKKLSEGNHIAYLEFLEDDKYYGCVSNNFKVKVRSTPIQDINLYLYPEYKILENDDTAVVCHVYACDKNNNPLSTSFRMWSSYDIKKDKRYDCGVSSLLPTNYVTDDTGWVSFTMPLNALNMCNGTLIQAISTIDDDIYSNVVFIRRIVDRPLAITDGLFNSKTKYSYKDEVIGFNGFIVDEEENRIPNEWLNVRLFDDEVLINETRVLTDVKGEFDYEIKNNGVRLDNLSLKVYHEANSRYGVYDDENTVLFYPPKTNISTNDLTVYRDEGKISIIATVIDEFNNLVIDGDVSVKIDGVKYDVGIVNGVCELEIPMLSSGVHNLNVDYDGLGYYENSSCDVNIEVLKLDTALTMNIPEITYSDEFSIDGVLTNSTRGKTIGKTDVNLFINNELIKTVKTDSNGAYEFKHTILDNSLKHDFKVVYDGSDDFKSVESVKLNYDINKETSVINAVVPRIVYNENDLVITGSLLTDDGEVIGERVDLVLTNSGGEDLVYTTIPEDDGSFSFVVEDLDIGDYDYRIVHDESDNYTSCELLGELVVKLDVLVLSAYLDTENDTDKVYEGEVFIITVIDEDFDTGIYNHKDVFENLEFHIYDSNGDELNVPYETNTYDDATIYTVLYGSEVILNEGVYNIRIVSPKSDNHDLQIIEKQVTIYKK